MAPLVAEHDLFRKPTPTFPDHALASFGGRPIRLARLALVLMAVVVMVSVPVMMMAVPMIVAMFVTVIVRMIVVVMVMQALMRPRRARIFAEHQRLDGHRHGI